MINRRKLFFTWYVLISIILMSFSPMKSFRKLINTIFWNLFNFMAQVVIKFLRQISKKSG
jgi:hypothetical protein